MHRVDETLRDREAETGSVVIDSLIAQPLEWLRNVVTFGNRYARAAIDDAEVY